VVIGGVRKSRLATALGYTACQHGHSVLFASAIDIVNTLAAAQASGRLKSGLHRYVLPRVLICDELGYLPIDKSGADLLFQIISQRYERGATVIATNRPACAPAFQPQHHHLQFQTGGFRYNFAPLVQWGYAHDPMRAPLDTIHQ